MTQEAPKGPQANARQEVREIGNLVVELNQVKGTLEFIRADLKADLISKLGEKPSFFSRNLLSDLAAHKDPDIRAAVAGNVNTHQNLLIRLSLDKDNTVKLAVASNPKTPLPVRVSVIDFLSRSADYVYRVEAAASPLASFETFERLSKDPDTEVRQLVAENPATPPAVVRLMSKEDPNTNIRELALVALGKRTNESS